MTTEEWQVVMGEAAAQLGVTKPPSTGAWRRKPSLLTVWHLSFFRLSDVGEWMKTGEGSDPNVRSAKHTTRAQQKEGE